MQLLHFPENCCLSTHRQTLKMVFMGVPTIFCMHVFPPLSSLKHTQNSMMTTVYRAGLENNVVPQAVKWLKTLPLLLQS